MPVQRRALETALLLRESEGAPPDARVLGLALISIMRTLAEQRPLLVAIDDVQWLDASSADVLAFALRRLEAEPIAVFATVRGRQVDVPLALDRAFSGFRRLPVEPLSVGAIHRLLWGRLGLALPRPVLIRVHRTTGGNPFFALELGRALTDGTIRADSVDVALPESLRAVVAQRLSALPGRVRETLVAVAALASPSVTVLTPLGGTVVDDLELAQRRHVAGVRRRPDPIRPSASRPRLLRGDASAQTTPAARTSRRPRRRSGGTRTAPRDRGRRPERGGRSCAR